MGMLLKSVYRLSVLVSATYRFRISVSSLVLIRCVCIHTNKRQRLHDKRYVTATELFFSAKGRSASGGNETCERNTWATIPLFILRSYPLTLPSPPGERVRVTDYYSPIICTTIFLSLRRLSKSTKMICCQVPKIISPFTKGTVKKDFNKAARRCAYPFPSPQVKLCL